MGTEIIVLEHMPVGPVTGFPANWFTIQAKCSLIFTPCIPSNFFVTLLTFAIQSYHVNLNFGIKNMWLMIGAVFQRILVIAPSFVDSIERVIYL